MGTTPKIKVLNNLGKTFNNKTHPCKVSNQTVSCPISECIFYFNDMSKCFLFLWGLKLKAGKLLVSNF